MTVMLSNPRSLAASLSLQAQGPEWMYESSSSVFLRFPFIQYLLIYLFSVLWVFRLGPSSILDAGLSLFVDNGCLWVFLLHID